MSEQKLEQLFRDSLSNFEADVDPNVWSNIQQGLQAPVSPNPVAGNSAALKSAGILGNMSVKSLVLLSAVTVSVIGTVIYFATKEPEQKNIHTTTSPAVVTEVQAPVIEKQIASPANDAHVETIKEPVNQKTASSQTKKEIIPVPEKVNSGSPGNSTGSNEKAPVKNSITRTGESTSPARPDYGIPDKAADNKPSASNVIPGEEKKSADQDHQADANETDPAFVQIEDYLVTDEQNKKGLPNSFSPNGDRTNDVFKIKTHNLKTMEVIIFDISGREIYSWKSLNGEWDGKMPDGREAPSGNYYYSLNAETADGKICIAQSFLKLFR